MLHNIAEKAKRVVSHVVDKGSTTVQKGKEILTSAANNAQSAIEFITKSYQFEQVITNDQRFQDKCTMLILMLQNDSDAENIETVITNAYILYALYYFQDKTFFLSNRLMKFMLRYPMKLESNTDISDYISLFEDHCIKHDLTD